MSPTASRLLLDLVSCCPVMVLCVFFKNCEVVQPKQRPMSPESSLVSSHTQCTLGSPDQKLVCLSSIIALDLAFGPTV